MPGARSKRCRQARPLTRVGRLAERERPGCGKGHQCRTRSLSARERSPTRVKGGIARAPGSRKSGGKRVDMHKPSYIIPNADRRFIEKSYQETITLVETGIQEKLDLILRDGLWTLSFSFFLLQNIFLD